MATRGKVRFSLGNLLDVAKATHEAMMSRYVKIGLAVERVAKQSMKKGGGKSHKPSAPGTPPHAQTGNLHSAITTARDEASQTVVVGPTRMAWYGRIHEFGGTFTGRNRTVTFPQRAFMHPALEAVSKNQIAKYLGSLPLASTPTGRKLNSKRGR